MATGRVVDTFAASVLDNVRRDTGNETEYTNGGMFGQIHSRRPLAAGSLERTMMTTGVVCSPKAWRHGASRRQDNHGDTRCAASPGPQGRRPRLVIRRPGVPHAWTAQPEHSPAGGCQRALRLRA